MVVPAARLELARPFDRQILSLLCLPFHQAGTRETLAVTVFQIKWLCRKRPYQNYVRIPYLRILLFEKFLLFLSPVWTH